jgi:nitrogen-specific signal transduction histidine kinase
MDFELTGLSADGQELKAGRVSGLGLHIAWQIAQAHGGRIAVTSTPAETRFVFTMPLRV